MSAAQAIVARVPTDKAARYMTQLAKHWSHKFEVQFTPTAATIDLPLGRCELAADDQALEVTLKGTPHVDMARFKTVVAEHLQRFGHRETLTFDWRDAASGAA